MSHDEDVVTMLALTNAMRKRWKRRMFTMDASLCMLAAERADNMAFNASLTHSKGPAENISGFSGDSGSTFATPRSSNIRANGSNNSGAAGNPDQRKSLKGCAKISIPDRRNRS